MVEVQAESLTALLDQRTIIVYATTSIKTAVETLLTPVATGASVSPRLGYFEVNQALTVCTLQPLLNFLIRLSFGLALLAAQSPTLRKRLKLRLLCFNVDTDEHPAGDGFSCAEMGRSGGFLLRGGRS